MKKSNLLFLVCSTVALGGYSAVVSAAEAPAGLALRYITVARAVAVIKEQLGAPAATAVSSVNEKQNVITLDVAHAQTPTVRAFLTGLDQRPPEVRVEVAITKRLQATATSAAHDEVVSRRTLLNRAGQPAVLNIPGDPDSTRIEFRITQSAE